MEKVIATFDVLCVTRGFQHSSPSYHLEETGKAIVIERSVTASFCSDKELEHPLVGLTYTVVKFRQEEHLLTCVADGLDGMAVCLMVKPLSGTCDWLKLFTDTPTPKGQTTEAVRQNAKQTIESRYTRGGRW